MRILSYLFGWSGRFDATDYARVGFLVLVLWVALYFNAAAGVLGEAEFGTLMSPARVEWMRQNILSTLILFLDIFTSTWIMVCAIIKRFHDMGRSVWYLALAFVPGVNLFLALILLGIPGQKGANRYGPPRR